MTSDGPSERPSIPARRSYSGGSPRGVIVPARMFQIALGTALLACCLPGVAIARRLASRDTKLAVIAAVRSAHELGTPQTASCLRVYVSTVNSNWATMQFVYSRPCERLDGNGVAVLHRTYGRWKLVTAGSEFFCPMPGHMPKRVQADLRLYCAPR